MGIFNRFSLMREVKKAGGAAMYAAQNVAAIYCVLKDLRCPEEDLLPATAIISTSAFAGIEIDELKLSVLYAQTGTVCVSFYRRTHGLFDVYENKVLNLAMQLVALEFSEDDFSNYRSYVDAVVEMKPQFSEAVAKIMKKGKKGTIYKRVIPVVQSYIMSARFHIELEMMKDEEEEE